MLIPEHSGVLSALGMLVADVRKDSSVSVLRATAEMSEAELAGRFAPLLTRAKEELRGEGFSEPEIRLKTSLEMRYVGQAYEIAVAFERGFEQAFHRMHERLYGYSNAARATEIVQLRVKASGRTEKPVLGVAGEVEQVALPEPSALREVIFGRSAGADSGVSPE